MKIIFCLLMGVFCLNCVAQELKTLPNSLKASGRIMITLKNGEKLSTEHSEDFDQIVTYIAEDSKRTKMNHMFDNLLHSDQRLGPHFRGELDELFQGLLFQHDVIEKQFKQGNISHNKYSEYLKELHLISRPKIALEFFEATNKVRFSCNGYMKDKNEDYEMDLYQLEWIYYDTAQAPCTWKILEIKGVGFRLLEKANLRSSLNSYGQRINDQERFNIKTFEPAKSGLSIPANGSFSIVEP